MAPLLLSERMEATAESWERGLLRNTVLAEVLREYQAEVRALEQAAKDYEDLYRGEVRANAALEAKVPVWVSVKERLPTELGRLYLVWVPWDEGGAMSVATLHEHHAERFFANYGGGHITHWMPLPSPPSQEEMK